MRGIVLLTLVACNSSARSDHGTLLYASASQWVVQHDDPLSRTFQGSEVYAAPSDAPPPGSHVDLWIDRDASGWARIERYQVTGTDPLPANFVPGGSPVLGTVVRVDERKLLVDHEAIEGVMPAMVMPFIAPRITTTTLTAGDRITGTLIASQYGYAITDIQTIGTEDVSGGPLGEPLTVGQVMPRFELATHDGGTLQLGGSGPPTVLTFIYTTCPDPNFCPATILRLQGLVSQLPDGARMVAVTIDPEHDTIEVLRDYAALAGAQPPQWSFARATPAQLHALAVAAGLTVSVRSGRIAHSTRLLVLNGAGELATSFDDNDFASSDVIAALTTPTP